MRTCWRLFAFGGADRGAALPAGRARGGGGTPLFQYEHGIRS